MTLAELSRNAAFRLSAMFVALFSGAMILAFLAVYWQAGQFLDQHLSDRLAETRDALIVVATRDGFDSLRNVVQSEASTVRDSDTILAMVDRSGRFLAGNAASVRVFEGRRQVLRSQIPEMAARAAYDDRFIAEWSDFEGGKLLVGVSDRGAEDTRDAILTGLGTGLVSMLTLAALSGLWLARRAQSRIDDFALTLKAISRGKLDRRVPLSGRGDDLDQVGQQLNEALDRLALLIERKNQSTSAIAHELRSPIGRVRQKLERMLDEAVLPEKPLHEAIGDIDRIVEIIEAILRIGQIQSGARRKRFTPVELAHLIADVAEVYEPVAEEAGQTIACLPPMADALIFGDPQLLTQMFANLIENAVRHCPPGTHIELSLEATAEGLEARVEDNGAGIPEHERQRVLEPFARLEESRTTLGAGLGLSLVAAIAELHGAKLVLGDAGPGLSVVLRFPNSTHET